MKIVSITRYKHGNLYQAIKQLGWNQSRLAEKSQLSPIIISDIINLKRRPTQKEANKIQTAFAAEGLYFDVLEEWPETFRLKKSAINIQIEEVPLQSLVGCKEAFQVECETTIENPIYELLDEEIKRLRPKMKDVIRQRFYQGKSLDEVAASFGLISKMSIHQTESKALRIIRTRIERNVIKNQESEALAEIEQRLTTKRKTYTRKNRAKDFVYSKVNWERATGEIAKETQKSESTINREKQKRINQ